MADGRTVAVYDRLADAWIRARQPTNTEGADWVAANRLNGPVVDLGCGPGWHLANVADPTVALDISRPMLRRCLATVPHAAPVQASVDALPFRSRSCGGVIASRVHLHLPADEVPLALADLHRCLRPGAPAFIDVLCLDALEMDHLGAEPVDGVAEARSEGRFAGRLFSAWGADRLRDVITGAGFIVDDWRQREASFLVRLVRADTLPDTVGPDMKLLICGLNPSIYSADVGLGFGRPGNRFWPAALSAGLLTIDRDPRHALLVHGIGMTDLVKRATRKASELSPDEYRQGVDRLERLTEWLRPEVVCFVGLAGWRAAVDRKATAGRQDRTIGGRPVYLMPSTSGLNAHSRLPDLTAHLEAAAHIR